MPQRLLLKSMVFEKKILLLQAPSGLLPFEFFLKYLDFSTL